MEIKELYRYEREPNKVTVSLIKPNCEYQTLYRIIATEGHLVTQDGVNLYACIDTETKDGWYEVEIPNEDEKGEVL